MQETNETNAPAAESRCADKPEILAGYVASGEWAPCGLSVEWLMDQLTGKGDRS